MSQPIRGQGGHLDFSIGPKNTNLVEGVEILLPVKFRWILFSRFIGEVENVKVYGRRTPDGRTPDGRTDGRTTDGALWQYLTRAFGSGELETRNPPAGPAERGEGMDISELATKSCVDILALEELLTYHQGRLFVNYLVTIWPFVNYTRS